MESLQPSNPIANICDGSESVTAAMDGLTKAGVALVESAAEIGLAGNVAALYRSDPLEAEGALRDMVFDMTRTILRDAFELLDDHGAAVEAGGRTHRRAVSGHSATCSFSVDPGIPFPDNSGAHALHAVNTESRKGEIDRQEPAFRQRSHIPPGEPLALAG